MKNNFQKKDRKAFTIVELVIVIAVIAILAAVLIPTFSNIIKRSQISADVQLCRNLNTVLANAQAEGRIPGSMYDVLYLENEAGYVLSNLNPTTEGFYFAWDKKQNKILFIESDLETVRFPDDYTLDPTSCWVTCGSVEEMLAVSEKNFNIYLECDIDAQNVEFHNVVSIDTGAFTLSNLTVNSTSSTPVEAWLIGNFSGSGTLASNSGVSINAPNATINTRGVISSLSIAGNNSFVNISGTVSDFTGSTGVTSTIQGNGLVNSINGGSNVVNNGVVIANNTTGSTSGNGAGSVVNNRVPISSKEDLETIRIQVATGKRNFKDETIELTGDINMNGIAFQPISSYYRKTSEDNSSDIAKTGAGVWFQGTFDGKGYSITNFSNSGFSIDGLTFGVNDSSVKFGSNPDKFGETIYGIFAAVYNAEIRNLNVTCNLDMTIDTAKHYVGDSIGGIIGFACGDYLRMDNCTVSGTIKGYDGVGGLVGRAYVKEITLNNCVNNANVTGVRHTGGIIGFVSSLGSGKIKIGDEWVVVPDNQVTVTMTDCFNRGVITCLGHKYDHETLLATSGQDTNAADYYVVGAAYSGPNKFVKDSILDETKKNGSSYTENFKGFTNEGKVYLAGEEAPYTILDNDKTAWETAHPGTNDCKGPYKG